MACGCTSGGGCCSKRAADKIDPTPKYRLPEWFRQEVPNAQALDQMRGLLDSHRLHTVCESAKCPNLGQCWDKGNATFMIMGDTCTRHCRFCAVPTGKPQQLDEEEPLMVADAVRRLNLRYVVITSVTRDDLPDQGAVHFAQVIRAVKEVNPGVKVELLIPDFRAEEDLLQIVHDAGADVIGHNIETVRRLTKKMRSVAEYDRSLQVLKILRGMSDEVMVKSGLMVGLGETESEVLDTLQDLLDHGCQIATIGQYLQPTKDPRSVPVEDFVTPDQFATYKKRGMRMGFKFIHAGPLVRSSFLAEEGYEACVGAKEALS